MNNSFLRNMEASYKSSIKGHMHEFQSKSTFLSSDNNEEEGQDNTSASALPFEAHLSLETLGQSGCRKEEE